MDRAEVAAAKYPTPFKRHLSFFDRNGDGIIHFGESLRGNLSIGLDFPVAVVMAMGYHSIYGNVRPFFFGPFNPIDIDKVAAERDMLQNVQTRYIASQGLDRKALLTASNVNGVLEKMHVTGLWAFAANRDGYLTGHDIERYQKGVMLYDLEQRRRSSREDVLPLYRGGPISVAGHSWFVDKLFGVKVYQERSSTAKGK